MKHLLLSDSDRNIYSPNIQYYVVFDSGKQIKLNDYLSQKNIDINCYYNICKVGNHYIFVKNTITVEDFIIYVNDETEDIDVKFIGFLPTKLMIDNNFINDSCCLFGLDRSKQPVVIKIDNNAVNIENISNLLSSDLDYEKFIKDYFSKLYVGEHRFIYYLDSYYKKLVFIYDTQNPFSFIKTGDNKSDLNIIYSSDFLEGKTDFYILNYKSNDKQKLKNKVSVYYRDKELITQNVVNPKSYSFRKREGFFVKNRFDIDKYLSIKKDTKYIAFNLNGKIFNIYKIENDSVKKIDTYKINEKENNLVKVLSSGNECGNILLLSGTNNTEKILMYNVITKQTEVLSNNFKNFVENNYVRAIINEYSLKKYFNKEKTNSNLERYTYPYKNNSQKDEEYTKTIQHLFHLFYSYSQGKSDYYITKSFTGNSFYLRVKNINSLVEFFNIQHVSNDYYLATRHENDTTKLIKIENGEIKEIQKFKSVCPNIYINEKHVYIQDLDCVYLYDIDNMTKYSCTVPIRGDILLIDNITKNLCVLKYHLEGKEYYILLNTETGQIKNTFETMGNAIDTNNNNIFNYVRITQPSYYNDIDIYDYPVIFKNYYNKHLYICDKEGNIAVTLKSDNTIAHGLIFNSNIDNTYKWFSFERNRLRKIKTINNILEKGKIKNNNFDIKKFKI